MQNDNGKKLLGVCRGNSLLPVNNLRIGRAKHFQGGFTFRKRKRWTSEIDYCVVSENIAKQCVTKLSVIANVDEPICKLSDHAPVTIDFKFPIDPLMLLERARTLCEHVLPADSDGSCKVPISAKKT